MASTRGLHRRHGQALRLLRLWVFIPRVQATSGGSLCRSDLRLSPGTLDTTRSTSGTLEPFDDLVKNQGSELVATLQDMPQS